MQMDSPMATKEGRDPKAQVHPSQPTVGTIKLIMEAGNVHISIEVVN